jgi:hypothetical protein
MPPSLFLKINFNTILPFTPRCAKRILCLRFPHRNPLCTIPLPSTCYTPRPSHPSRFDHPNNIWWRHHKLQLCSLLHSPVISTLLCQNFLLNTLFWNALSLRSLLKVTDQVSHPYKTSDKNYTKTYNSHSLCM